MQSPSFLAALAAAATLVSTGAGAQESQAQAAPAWRCDGAACLGRVTRPSTASGLVQECKRVAAAIGPVSRYRSHGQELTPGQLRACNRRAVQIQTARN